jgi:predicted class III extradiol MEMO1 family dioxygenase
LSSNFISTSYTDILSYNSNISSNTPSKLKIDTNTINKLKPYLQIDDKLFKEEHSFYNQLPFIEYIVSSQKKHASQASQASHVSQTTLLLPFLISNSLNLLDIKTRDSIRKILNTLIELLKSPDNILICTSDFSHINGKFDYKIKYNIFQTIRNKDSEILQFVYNSVNGMRDRTKKLDDILFIQNAPSCGTMAMYLFAKMLNSYSGGLDYSSSSSSSSDSSDDSTIIKKLNQNPNRLFPRCVCYYTSLLIDNNKLKINFDISNNNNNNNNNTGFHPSQLTESLEINDNDMQQSSVSYASIIFTTQPYVEYKTLRKIENMFAQYEKIALIGFVRELIFKKFRGMISKTALQISQTKKPINCQVFNHQPLGLYISVYKNDKLRGFTGTLGTESNTYSDDFTIESSIRQFVNNLVVNKTRYKDLHFTPLEPSEFNTLSFKLTVLNNIKPITLNEYFSNKFKFGNDGIIMQHINKQDISPNKALFSLSSIEEQCRKNINFGNGGNDLNNVNDRDNKQTLLESILESTIKSIEKYNHSSNPKLDHKSLTDIYKLSDMKLFYNEGIVFDDMMIL